MSAVPQQQRPVAVRTVAVPHRPVVTVALLLFVPSMWMVYEGNLTVQAAVIRFIGALVVSWVAARLVVTTVGLYAVPGSTQPTPEVPAVEPDQGGVPVIPPAGEAVTLGSEGRVAPGVEGHAPEQTAAD